MKKNISAALLSLACFSAVAAAAFADGPVAGAINGIERAGEEIVDGAGNAINGAVKGISGAADDIMGLDLDDGDALTPGGSDDPGDDNSDPTTSGDSDVTSDNSSDTTSEPESSDTSDTSSDASSDNSGAVGGINAANPGTGVTYGLTAGAAVLAAIGVVAATSRKNK